MKKLAVVLLSAALAASFVVPAFSATNPFMDVPMNHWAYDAIGQLAAHGILSGYPDGTYKGQQQTTRYELASALARALAVVDMTKASKQDVEMLKRLVVEFKDELEALGVRVDELDERVAVLEDRLGGWHIHGSLVLDVMNESRKEAKDAFFTGGNGSVAFDEARLWFERTWGENDDYFFAARLRDEAGAKGEDSEIRMDRFYVEMPFFFDSKMTVGRFNWAWEGDYKIDSNISATGSWMGGQVLTDWTVDGFGLTKNFGLGMARVVFAHPNRIFPRQEKDDSQKTEKEKENDNPDPTPDWMIMAEASLQFTEQIGLDIGGQVFVGDNAEFYYGDETYANGEKKHTNGDWSFNNLWTVFAGLRFNFNENIGLKGIFYHQAIDQETVYKNRWTDTGYGYYIYHTDGNGNFVFDRWEGTDDANHWAAIIDVKQAALKYTSLWLEYGQYDFAFQTMNDDGIFYGKMLQALGANANRGDVKYWRIGLGQEWNDKFSTHLFYYGYNIDPLLGGESYKPKEFGVGVQYKLNDYTTLGLNYMHAEDDGALTGRNEHKDNVVRFRTKVTF